MMGYAETRRGARARATSSSGALRTGDLGSVDEDGFFYLTGRLNRIAKLFGRRISLEDVERELERTFAAQVAATERERGTPDPRGRARRARPACARAATSRRPSRLPPQSIRVVQLPALPRTASGKKDYGALAS